MIVDLFGIPGSGKTTLADALVRELDSQGVKALNATMRTDSPIWQKLITRAFWPLSHNALLSSRRRMAETLSFCGNQTALFGLASARYYADSIAMMQVAGSAWSRFYDVVIFDEGVLQKLASLQVGYQLSGDVMAELLGAAPDFGLPLFISCSPDEAFESIRLRNRHVCSIDELSDEDTKRFLVSYDAACNDLRSLTGASVIERSDAVEASMVQALEIMGQMM